MAISNSNSQPATPPIQSRFAPRVSRTAVPCSARLPFPSFRLSRRPPPPASLAGKTPAPAAPFSQASGRVGEVKRVTNETDVHVKLNVDGTGVADCDTGIPFLDHMLDQLSSHGLFDLYVKARGDLHIDDHHTNEDIALAIGTALFRALGDRKGINRFGNYSAPLDEALVNVVLDLSGRPHLSHDLDIPAERVGNYDTQLVEHLFQSLVNTSGMTLHILQFKRGAISLLGYKPNSRGIGHGLCSCLLECNMVPHINCGAISE